MAIYPYARRGRQTIGVRGLSGDLLVTGDAAPVIRELLENTERVACMAHGVVLSAEDLQGTNALPRSLTTLQLYRIDQAHLRHLQSFSDLQHLDCSGIAKTLGKDGLRHIADCPTIQSLSLRGCNIDDDGLMLLTDLVRLRELDLSDCSAITGDGFFFFSASAKSRVRPESVRLNRCTSLSGSGLLRLVQFLNQPNTLERAAESQGVRLYLRDARENMADEAWGAIMGLHDLRALDLAGWQLGDRQIRQMMGLHDLQWLSLDGCAINDGDLETLLELRELRHLDLRDNADLSMDGIAKLAKLPALQRLDLRGLELDADALAVLAFSHQEIEILR